MGLLPFQPARNKARESEVICDLDSILEDKVLSFRLHGKTHLIAPITTKVFWAFVNGIMELRSKDPKTPEQSDQWFFDTVRPLCQTITLKDIQSMTMVQKGALIEMLSSKIMGKQPHGDDEKKNP